MGPLPGPPWSTPRPAPGEMERGGERQGDPEPASRTCLFLSKTRRREGRKRMFWISHASGFPQECGDQSPPCEDSEWMVRMR